MLPTAQQRGRDPTRGGRPVEVGQAALAVFLAGVILQSRLVEQGWVQVVDRRDQPANVPGEGVVGPQSGEVEWFPRQGRVDGCTATLWQADKSTDGRYRYREASPEQRRHCGGGFQLRARTGRQRCPDDPAAALIVLDEGGRKGGPCGEAEGRHRGRVQASDS